MPSRYSAVWLIALACAILCSAEDASPEKETPRVKLGIIQINVTDLRKAKEFYGSTLGLEVKEVNGKDAPFELKVEGGPKVLVYQVEKQAKNDYPDQTGATLVFHCADIEKAVKEWKAKGVEFIAAAWADKQTGIAECPYGRFAAFKDPFGNVHELLEPKQETGGK